MIEPTTFDDPPEPAAVSATDRSMRVLESAVAFLALASAIVLAVLPH